MTGKVRIIVGCDLLLQGAGDELAARLRRELTVENPRYRDAKRYGRWVGKNLSPVIRVYREDDQGFHLPRGFARRLFQLCREAAGTDPQVTDQRRTLPAVGFRFQGRLRPYQDQALSAVCRRDSGVLEAPTGAGKTVVALAVVAARDQPTLILVHTKELLHQWHAQVQRFLNVAPALLGDGRAEVGPITVGIVNSVRSRLATLPQHFGHLCVDECHRVPASLFTEVVRAFDCRYLLGLSATVFRRDGLDPLIHHYLGPPVHRISTTALQTDGAVLRPRYRPHQTTFHYRYRGDYQQLLARLTSDEERNRRIAADVATAVASGATVLVVSDRVAHCHRLADLLRGAGLEPLCLTGRTPAEERRRITAQVKAGRARLVVATLQLIGEGFDCPALDTLFLTTPIRFNGRLQQVVGRILRPAPGKEATVHDYLDPVGVLQRAATARRAFFAAHGDP